ncbi:MAG: polysaccharide biosynthesis protein [Solirubrobacteraceae bacterium MAG38_C4-C5]|nr:polysaccharide biosynthesis protein [Candidatus Siliceabacter maunaloa]
MSTGCAAIPLLKAAPRPEQVAERLASGPWGGLELCLMPADVADDGALDAAVRAVTEADPAPARVTAEAPVAWPSGAFVRVDELTAEAREGIERSADFAARIGSPVLTIHLFVPQEPAVFRTAAGVDEEAVHAFLDAFARACQRRGVTPLIENVPPILRMRTGGVFLSPIGGHWRDLLAWRERVPALGFTLDTSHAALFRTFGLAAPAQFAIGDPDELVLDRYVAELAAHTHVAHVSDATGVLGEGLPYGEGELDLDPVVRRLAAAGVPAIVAEVNEPDPARSPAMKAGHRAIEAALREPAQRWHPRAPRLRPEPFDWPGAVGRRDPLPAVLGLEERFAGRRVLITGGAGSIGTSLASLLLAFRPRTLTLLDVHEASLTADRRAREAEELVRTEHVLCDVRERRRLEEEVARARPDVIFHLAAYKHVDWAERFPEEFAATNLDGSWNVLRAAGEATVVVASTDKAARAAGRYGRSKRLMEALTALAGERTDGGRAAVRLVNVLGSAGSASDLFLRQARAGVPLTVTDGGMRRYWITMGHAATLLAHGALSAADVPLLTAAEPVTLSVGEVAERIWRGAGRAGAPDIALLGVRVGETMDEVLVGQGEVLGVERFAGCVPIEGTAAPAGDIARELVARLDAEPDPTVRRSHWTQALTRPLVPAVAAL